jgi:hypothetical protein
VAALLALSGLSAGPAQAAPTVTLIPSSGPVGSSFKVSGSGWTPPSAGEVCPVAIGWDGIDQPDWATQVDSTGGFGRYVTVPAGSTEGGHSVSASASGTCAGTFKPGAPNFTVTPPPAATTTTAPVAATTTSTTRPPATTTTTAVATTTTTVLATTTVVTTTTGSTEGTTTTTPPPPPLDLDRPFTPPAGPANVRGRSCDPLAPVSLEVGGRDVGHATADTSGHFDTPIELPDLPPGRYDVIARCGPVLSAPIDVVLASANRPGSTLAILVFFVLVGFGLWILRRAVAPARPRDPEEDRG